MFKVYPASLQTFIDPPYCVLEDRFQYSTVDIPNVFCDDHLQIMNFVGIVRICRVFRQVHRDVLFTCSRIRGLSNLHLRPLKTFISEFNLSSILLPKLALGCGLPLVFKRNNEPSSFRYRWGIFWLVERMSSQEALCLFNEAVSNLTLYTVKRLDDQWTLD
jgi:hypothetical protein